MWASHAGGLRCPEFSNRHEMEVGWYSLKMLSINEFPKLHNGSNCCVSSVP